MGYESIRLYKLVLEKSDPRLYEPLFTLAQTFLLSKDLDVALEYLDQAIEILKKKEFFY
jgi:hypothetical protein